MKTISAITALLLASAAVASNDDSPVRYRAHGMTVLMHSSMKTVTLVDGDNVLGNPVAFTCASTSGCALVIDATVKKANDNGGGLTCAYVDDSVPPPGCGPDAAYYGYQTAGSVHEQAKVAPGAHTAKLVVNDGAGVEVTGWTAQYTIYERKVHGTN